MAPHLASAAPPLRGTTTADVVIVGGGYTGLWTALRITELEPTARVVLLEADICGGGPSGRNGGFVTNWWDDFPTLIERYGVDGARAMGDAMEAAVDEVGGFCASNAIDAWFTKAGSLSVSAAPAQDGSWTEAVEALRGHGLGDRYVPLTAEEVAARVRSPVFRDGAFMPGAATVQPATLARGLRRVLLERGVVIAEGSEVVEIDGQRPGALGAVGAGARQAPSRRGNGVGFRPVRVRTVSEAGDGEVLAGAAVIALNAWAAGWPWFGRRLVTWSSYIVLTEPIPERLADIGWTGGEGVADARFTLHYLRTTPDGRIAIGGGGGRAGFGGRIDGHVHRGPHRRPGGRPRASGGCSRRPPTSGSRTRGAGPSTSAPTTSRGSARSRGGPSTTATATAATGSGRRWSVAGSSPHGRWSGPTTRRWPCRSPTVDRHVASRRSRRATSGRGSCARRPPVASRSRSGARARDRLLRELSRLPRRLGYHLGPH